MIINLDSFNKKPTSFRCEPLTHKILSLVADKEDRSQSDIINDALNSYFSQKGFESLDRPNHYSVKIKAPDKYS